MIDLSALAAPFSPERISWRVGSTNADKTRGMALAYIDARDVMDRLNEVCGPWWQCRYPHANGKTICEIGLKIGDEWIWRADGAGDTDVEAEKGAISDAFKRAAVKWGIGKYLYDLKSPWVELEPAGRSYKIKESEHAKLRAMLGKQDRHASGQAPEEPRTAGSAVSAQAVAARPPVQQQAHTNGHTYHLVNPHEPKEKWEFDRGSLFLDVLKQQMDGGNAADWWAVNGSTAKWIATLHPQAKARVDQLEAMASGGLLAAG